MYADNKATMQRVAEFLELPYFEFDSELMDKSWGGGASNRYENPHDYPPLSNETRADLREFFRPYNERLYKLIGRDLGWE